jgi:hypothetical protein
MINRNKVQNKYILLIYIIILLYIYIYIMSGQLTCSKVQENIENRKTSESAMKTLNSIATFGVSDILDNSMPTQDPVVSIIRNNYKEIKEKISLNNCQNISTTSQQNILIQSPKCYDAIRITCTNNKTGIVDKECLDMLYETLDSYSNKQTEQININKLSSICEINSALQVLSEQEQDLAKLTTIQIINDAKLKAMEKKSDNVDCSEINTNITNDQYTRSFLSCINQTSVNQENIIRDCTPDVSLQLNDNNDMKKCLLNTGIFNKTDQSSNINLPIKTTTSPNNITTTPPNKTTSPPNNNIAQITGIPLEYIIITIVVVIIVIVLFATKTI